MDWLQAGNLQLVSLLFVFPEAKNRRAPVQEFTASTLFALGNGNNNRNKVNSQSLSLVKSQVNNHGKDKEKQKSYLSKG